MTKSPYISYVDAEEDVVLCLERTPGLIAALVTGWTADEFERSYAPGKWTARQLLVHLAQTEIVFGARLRFALASDGYVVQPFHQDAWMRSEPDASAADALAAYRGLRQLTLARGRLLTIAERAKPVTHPEFGVIDVAWMLTTLAGHERHHLPHFQAIART